MVTGTGRPLALVATGRAAGTVLAGREVVSAVEKLAGVIDCAVTADVDWPVGSAELSNAPDRPAWGCMEASSMTGVGGASVVLRSSASRTSSPWGWEGTRASLSPAGNEPPTTEAWIASAPPVMNSPVPEVVRSSRPASAASLRYQGDQVPFSLTRR